MINDGRKIILSFDYIGNELNRAFLFALERKNLFDFVSEYYRRVVVAAFFFLACFYWLGWSFFSAFFLSILTAAFVTSFVPLVFFYLYFKFAVIAFDRASESGLKPMKLPVTFIFDDDGIERTFKSAPRRYVWEQIGEAIETDEGLYLFINKNYPDFIPKRALENLEELIQLKDLIRQKISKRAKF